jgi:hypothetical protein
MRLIAQGRGGVEIGNYEMPHPEMSLGQERQMRWILKGAWWSALRDPLRACGYY